MIKVKKKKRKWNEWNIYRQTGPMLQLNFSKNALKRATNSNKKKKIYFYTLFFVPACTLQQNYTVLHTLGLFLFSADLNINCAHTISTEIIKLTQCIFISSWVFVFFFEINLTGLRIFFLCLRMKRTRCKNKNSRKTEWTLLLIHSEKWCLKVKYRSLCVGRTCVCVNFKMIHQ